MVPEMRLLCHGDWFIVELHSIRLFFGVSVCVSPFKIVPHSMKSFFALYSFGISLYSPLM